MRLPSASAETSPEARVRRGGARSRQGRHADYRRRCAVESCPRHCGGGGQTGHARVLVANGARPARPTANALLDVLLGADIVYVVSRDDRAPKMQEIADALRTEGRYPYVIPIGASIPLGALGFVLAVAELVEQMDPPDFIFHSTSSGGTQAGLIAGCRLLDLPTRVIGISADDPSESLSTQVDEIVRGVFQMLRLSQKDFAVEVDDTFVGEGYGIPTAASREAIEPAARSEAIFIDPTYTAKAMAAPDRVPAPEEIRRGPDRGVLAYRRPGRVVCLRALYFFSADIQLTTTFIGFVSGPLTSLLIRNDCPSAATSKSMMRAGLPIEQRPWPRPHRSSRSARRVPPSTADRRRRTAPCRLAASVAVSRRRLKCDAPLPVQETDERTRPAGRLRRRRTRSSVRRARTAALFR